MELPSSIQFTAAKPANASGAKTLRMPHPECPGPCVATREPNSPKVVLKDADIASARMRMTDDDDLPVGVMAMMVLLNSVN